ncbi:7164_t:CDS:2 [Acaulospora colombiana]|uniref:7164_t:CDS:1 n=1 Tax=Acaulospora colombiana TaxID=27376 RepID=A0ACA9KSC7_9GLOM|nr:7164_t:CDS:2 [Acaulospora colombiana]
MQFHIFISLDQEFLKKRFKALLVALEKSKKSAYTQFYIMMLFILVTSKHLDHHAKFTYQNKEMFADPSFSVGRTIYLLQASIMQRSARVLEMKLERYLEVFPRSSLSKPLKNVEDRMKRWLEDKEYAAEYDAYRRFIIKELMSFGATHFVFNDSVSLKIASTLPSTIRVFICHACEHLPFGPYGGVPGFGSSSSQTEHKWLKEIEGVWAVSRAIKDYMTAHGRGLHSTYLPLHPAIFGKLPFKKYYNFDSPYVLAINPGSVKGYTIFRNLAERMEDVKFAAVESWCVSEYQLKELEKMPNVATLPMFKNMEELWPLAKVLLVPSIWYEAFGLVVVEAMLRGIPVICSDAGGLVEAKCGVAFGTIHVNVINGERETDNDVIQEMGIYKIPHQNIEPWIQTLRSLLDDRETYERISRECHEKSTEHIQSIDVEAYARWFIELKSKSNSEDFLEALKLKEKKEYVEGNTGFDESEKCQDTPVLIFETSKIDQLDITMIPSNKIFSEWDGDPNSKPRIKLVRVEDPNNVATLTATVKDLEEKKGKTDGTKLMF